MNLPRRMSWLLPQLHSLGQVTHLPLVQETEQVWSEGLPLPQEFWGVGGSWGVAEGTLQTPLQGELPRIPPGRFCPIVPREEQQQTMVEGKLPQRH